MPARRTLGVLVSMSFLGLRLGLRLFPWVTSHPLGPCHVCCAHLLSQSDNLQMQSASSQPLAPALATSSLCGSLPSPALSPCPRPLPPQAFLCPDASLHLHVSPICLSCFAHLPTRASAWISVGGSALCVGLLIRVCSAHMIDLLETHTEIAANKMTSPVGHA